MSITANVVVKRSPRQSSRENIADVWLLSGPCATARAGGSEDLERPVMKLAAGEVSAWWCSRVIIAETTGNTKNEQ